MQYLIFSNTCKTRKSAIMNTKNEKCVIFFFFFHKHRTSALQGRYVCSTRPPKKIFNFKWTSADEVVLKRYYFRKNLQLSSCILHLCVSMGNKVRSSGQERVTDNLEEDGENAVSVFHYALHLLLSYIHLNSHRKLL